MKLTKIAMAMGLVVASVGAMAQLSAAGSGFTGSHHDWTRTALTTGGAGANAGSLTAFTGGTTAKAYYSLTSGGAAIVASAADITAGNFYAPAAGVLVVGATVGDGATQYKIQTTSTAAPVTTDVAGTKFASIRFMPGQCTKCHTPHVNKQTNLLWNHRLNSGNYTWEIPSTTAGTTYATFKGDTYKGSSSKCLSCHDGTIGGSDGVWFNNAFLGGDSRGTSSTGIAQGTNLSRTHPVAMPYPLNNVANTYNGQTNGSGLITSEWVADPTAANGIRLFNDDGAGNITGGAVALKSGMECNSCHDVHNGKTVEDEEYLLRGTLTGASLGGGKGYLCTKCHAK